MARLAHGVWRLHSDLVGVNYDLMHHARRRVSALQPDKTHRYEFARGNEATDKYGRTVFDLYIRYAPITQGESDD